MTSSANHGFGRVPDAFLDTLKDRTDVVALIGRRVELKKAGVTYKGLCPFHSEKSPSFTVSPTRQTYHCFGCGMHGGALSFLMEYEGTPFREAVEALAAEAGIALPSEMTGSGAPSVDTKPLFAAMERAARFFRYSLGQSDEAKAYLKGRGVIKETLNRFCIGFAPAGWRNLREAFSDYEHNPHIVDCGLVREKKADAQEGSGPPGGRTSRYDSFRRRITFGVRNTRGQLVAFGGRVIDPEDSPKYLNSAESAIFDKSSTLFGLYEARESIRAKREALVVEGYMDVVMLSQSGVHNVVAAMGTAFTRLHLERLLSTTSRIIYAFDGDAAGRKAAWRALETTMTVLEDEHDFRFLLLPSGLDPDELVQQEGLNAFEARASKALSLSEFLVRELTERHNGLATPEDRARFESEATEIVSKISFKTKLRRILLSHIAAEARAPGSAARAIQSTARPRPTRKTVWAALTEAARRAPAAAADLAQTIVPLLDLSAPDEAEFCQLLTDLARQAGAPSSAVADEVIARDTLYAAVDMIVSHREDQAKADLVRQFNDGELDEADYLRKRQALTCS
ncbi:MAG: DNA primase [Roseateles sp.]|nr:MAG: DNA primase [Roseateles sp.]